MPERLTHHRHARMHGAVAGTKRPVVQARFGWTLRSFCATEMLGEPLQMLWAVWAWSLEVGSAHLAHVASGAKLLDRSPVSRSSRDVLPELWRGVLPSFVLPCFLFGRRSPLRCSVVLLILSDHQFLISPASAVSLVSSHRESALGSRFVA